MSFRDEIEAEPWRFDFYEALRRFERANPDRPRIGDSVASREDHVLLGQNPYMDFPASTLAEAKADSSGRMRILVKFLGLLGPQGALPYATTEEVHGWLLAGDDSFPRFLDLFHNRFLQMFFRAWADARPAAQHDHRADRFFDYVGSTFGLGSPPYRDLDALPDIAKLEFAGLLGARTRSASRLRDFIAGLFGIEVEIEQFVGSRLAFDEADRSSLGQSNATLGQTYLLGASVHSLEDKIVVRLQTVDLAHYARFLPTGPFCEQLDDAIYFVVGHELTWDVELALPARALAPMRLSRFGQLGWTSWLAPRIDEHDETIRCDARFQPRRRRKAPAPPPAKKTAKRGTS